MGPEVLEAVTPPFNTTSQGRARGRLRAALDAITTGERLRVRMHPFTKSPNADLARVDPLAAQVWDVRTLTVKPYIRAFGRFGERNLFIALTWHWRNGLDFPCEIERCRNEWQRIFGYLAPHDGTSVNDFLSCADAV